MPEYRFSMKCSFPYSAIVVPFWNHPHIYFNAFQCFAASPGECRKNIKINGSIGTKWVKKIVFTCADILKVSTEIQY